MFSFRIKKAYMIIMLCSTFVSILLFSSDLKNLIALAKTQPLMIHSNSKIQVLEKPKYEVELALSNHIEYQHLTQLIEKQPENIALNRLQIRNNRGEVLKVFFKMIWQFLRVCDNVNKQCIPSFFNWIWNFITNPFTWVVGGLLLVAIVRSNSDD